MSREPPPPPHGNSPTKGEVAVPSFASSLASFLASSSSSSSSSVTGRSPTASTTTIMENHGESCALPSNTTNSINNNTAPRRTVSSGSATISAEGMLMTMDLNTQHPSSTNTSDNTIIPSNNNNDIHSNNNIFNSKSAEGELRAMDLNTHSNNTHVIDNSNNNFDDSNYNVIHSHPPIQPNISNSNNHQTNKRNYSVLHPVINPVERNTNTTSTTAYPASLQLLQQQQQKLQQLQMLKLLAQQQQQQQHQPQQPPVLPQQQPQPNTNPHNNTTPRPPPLLAPERAEATWAQELYEMEPPEREAINYELHGVQSRAVPETPEFLQTALQQLTVYVDTVIQSSEKRAYTYAVQTLQSTYVHTDELKVRFLRAELFDVSKAARRYCHGLQYLYDHFGDIALLRQLHLADLNAEETQFLHKGFKQLLPSRDRFGRRMMAHFGSYSSTYSYVTRAKVVTYLTFGVLAEDVTTQRQGVISLGFFSYDEDEDDDEEGTTNTLLGTTKRRTTGTTKARRSGREQRPTKTTKNHAHHHHHDPRKNLLFTETTEFLRFFAAVPLRWSGFHVCIPQEPVYQVLKSLLLTVIPKEMRHITRVHCGTSIECEYALKCFGVPTEDVPKTLVGNISTTYLTKWLAVRTAIDQHRAVLAQQDYRTYYRLSVAERQYPGLECPELNCVVFQARGVGAGSAAKYPGNVQLRLFLQERQAAQLQQQQQKQRHNDDDHPSPHPRAHLGRECSNPVPFAETTAKLLEETRIVEELMMEQKSPEASSSALSTRGGGEGGVGTSRTGKGTKDTDLDAIIQESLVQGFRFVLFDADRHLYHDIVQYNVLRKHLAHTRRDIARKYANHSRSGSSKHNQPTGSGAMILHTEQYDTIRR